MELLKLKELILLEPLSIVAPVGEKLRGIEDIPVLEKLYISARLGSDEECRWIGRSKSIKSLVFSGGFSNVGLARLANMKNLESLHLSGNISISEEGLRVLGRCPRLRWAAIDNNGYKAGYTNNIYSETIAREFGIGFAGACSCGCMDIEPPKAEVLSMDRCEIKGDTLVADSETLHSLDKTRNLRIRDAIERQCLRIDRRYLPRQLAGLYLHACKVKRLELVDCYLSEICVFGASRVEEIHFFESNKTSSIEKPKEPTRETRPNYSPAFYLGDVDELTFHSAPSLIGVSIYEARKLRSLKLVGDFPAIERLYPGKSPELKYLAAPYSGHAPALKLTGVNRPLPNSLRLLKMPGTAQISPSCVNFKSSLTQLHEVDMRRTTIDDSWLKSLADIRKLRILRIGGCKNLTEEAIAEFRKKRADVTLYDANRKKTDLLE